MRPSSKAGPRPRSRKTPSTSTSTNHATNTRSHTPLKSTSPPTTKWRFKTESTRQSIGPGWFVRQTASNSNGNRPRPPVLRGSAFELTMFVRQTLVTKGRIREPLYHPTPQVTSLEVSSDKLGAASWSSCLYVKHTTPAARYKGGAVYTWHGMQQEMDRW